ncbi:MAG TPA: amino acid adenylation domain-containing protein [Actinophytocola sp.]|uniref:amino acid adenylation domain-containing protein n=1 Tax=Actinophytocola sp. TaxID=1872138 RepID=UPI002DB723DE|nr:amino acid adenylation domain-containing protein [Actinophytocola sp.]HEU5471981.1 amino acid adenylation domain-containing protein [Actinophytocola sp.]
MTHPAQPWPPVLVPADRPRRPGSVRRTAVLRAELRLPRLALGAHADIVSAGFAAVLYRYTGQDRISLRQDGAQVRVRVGGESTLRELTAAVAIGRVRSSGPAELELRVLDGAVELHYDAALFNRDTVERLVDHYRTLLWDGVTHPDRPVSRLRLMTDPELRRVLLDWNRTEADLPHDACLHEAFQYWVGRSPNAVAVVHGRQRWTYRQLNASANRLAHHLRALGVGPDVRVGLCLDRSPGLLVAVLAILKAGGAYVPIDPDYPAARIAAMVEGTACSVTISRSAVSGNLPDTGAGKLILLDRDARPLSGWPEHDPDAVAGPDNLCYVIHTSGSTGAPKPIALCHRGVVNNLADLNTRFRVGPGDSVLALSSPSFDMSVYELLGITGAGGTVVLPEPGRTRDPRHWAELLAGHRVTIWNSAPALLGLLVEALEQAGGPALPYLRLAMLGGDWVPVPLADRVRAIAPGVRFIVLGGATEASIHSTIYEVTATDSGWPSIPYGRPMANQRTYILDDTGTPVPPGVAGELYLAGIGLARGYLDQPERTAERFSTWSYGEVRGERLYRTGDLARFGPDGLIELLGRKDFQVKINGLRVELGEIEAVLRAHPGVRQVAVAARDGRLVGYVVPAGGLSEDDLRELAASRLPAYMVPGAFLMLDRLPLSPNGKLDRAALPEPDRAVAGYRAGRSTRERALAEVYAEVLGLDRVGVDDDYLALGGDSIRAIQIVTKARGRGIEITPQQVLGLRSVAALAGVARVATESTVDDSAPLVTVRPADLAAWRLRYRRVADVWPLTPMQAGMLYESMRTDTGPDAYQLQTVYHLSGPVDPVRLRAAGQAVLDRYANLRAAFVTDAADELVAVPVDGVALPWREIDLSGAPDDAVRRFLAEDRARRFDPNTPPLLRMTLLRRGPERAALVVTAHHALIDGWSEQVLARDLVRLYAADEPEPVPGFRDFLAWLCRRDPDKSARAWADELAGVSGPTMLVPGASRARTADVAEVRVDLSPAESRLLTGGAAALGVTPSTLVQGAWAILLAALTGRTDVVFGATVAGRPAELTGVESMVGLFINTVPVRARTDPGDTIADLLTGLQIRQTALLDHQHLGLTEIHRIAGVDALFDTLVVFQSYPPGAGAAAGIEITAIDSVGTGSYPLTLIVTPGRLILQHDRDLVPEPAVRRLGTRFRAVLGQLAGPDRALGTLDVLPPDDPLRTVLGPAPVPAAPAHAPAYRPGRTPVESALCELIADVLGADRVGIDDHLFVLGCNSLKATRIISRIRRTLAIEVSIRTLFRYPTVATLAPRLGPATTGSRPGLRRMT